MGHGRRRRKKGYEVNNNEARKERKENMHSIGVWWKRAGGEQLLEPSRAGLDRS